MIVYRFWERRSGPYRVRLWEGWFLLGLIPLYVRLVKETFR